MKKQLILIFMLILSINIVLATPISLINLDSAWTINKQDGFESNLNYTFEYINETAYKLKWVRNNNFFFDTLLECDIRDSECINSKAQLEPVEVKDFEEQTEILFGLIKTDYTATDFKEVYLDNVDVSKEYIDYVKANGSRIVVTKGRGTVKGDIKPFDVTSGELIINMPDTIYKSNGLQIQIGEHTLITTFNNSLLNETLNLGLQYGFYNNITRYLSVPLFVNFTSATMNITGILGYYAIFNEIDYFRDGNIDTSLWTYSEIDPSNKAYVLENIGSLVSSIGVGSYTTYTGSNTLMLNGSNLYLENTSIAIKYQLYCSGANSAGQSRLYLYNGTDAISINDVSCSSISPLTQTSDAIAQLRIHPGYIEIYDGDNNAVTNQTFLGNLYLYFYNSVSQGSSGGTYMTAQSTVYYVGRSSNETLYQNFIFNSSTKTYPNSTNIYIGSTLAYTNTTQVIYKTNVTLLSALQTSYGTDSECSCTGCVKTSNDCIIPITFTSNNGGGIFYSDIIVDINETQLINNCSVPGSIPMINFTSIDEYSLDLAQITGTYTFTSDIGGSRTFFGTFNNINNFTVCIKNLSITSPGSYIVNYYPTSLGAGFTRTYTEPTATFDNITDFVTLYSYNNSQSDTVPFTFHTITETLGSDIPNVLVQAYKKINNSYQLIESDYTDTGGLYSGYLQQSGEYRFIFNKGGYNEYIYSTTFITSGTSYTIRMTGTNGTSSYLPDGSVQLFLEGVSIKYLPVGTLTNNTFYNFTINVTNYQLNQTMNTGTTTLYANNGTIILGTDSCVTSDNNCFMEIKDIEVLNTFYNINSVTSVNFDVFGDSVYYNYWAVGYEYEGELSLVTTINGDLNRFLINHIDNFGRFFLGFIIMFIVIAYVIRIVNIDYTYNQLPILIFICVLTWVLSWIGFFYVDVNSTLLTEGDKKWMVTFLVTLVCIAFYLREQQ